MAHKWSGWPGAYCLKCGAGQALEVAIAEGWYDPYEDTWDTKEHEQLIIDADGSCPMDIMDKLEDSIKVFEGTPIGDVLKEALTEIEKLWKKLIDAQTTIADCISAVGYPEGEHIHDSCKRLVAENQHLQEAHDLLNNLYKKADKDATSSADQAMRLRKELEETRNQHEDARARFLTATKGKGF